MKARFIRRRHHHGRLLTRRTEAGKGAGLPTLQLLAVFILLGAAGLSGIGHSSSSSDSEKAASEGANAKEQICESIDQCAEASPSQDPVAAPEPTRACPPENGDTKIAAGADELHTADSIDDPEKEGILETVAEPFAGAQVEKDGDCADILTRQNPQQP